jgi:hypothetical protein
MDYEDGEANDLVAVDPHAKESLPKERVDHVTTLPGKGHLVSISGS